MTITLAPRTQGQHDVLQHLVPPYSQFPKRVDGPTVWNADEFRAQPERWQKRWSAEHIRELDEAYEGFKRSGLPITAITRVSHVLPKGAMGS